jgi:hypothetical protein
MTRLPSNAAWRSILRIASTAAVRREEGIEGKED